MQNVHTSNCSHQGPVKALTFRIPFRPSYVDLSLTNLPLEAQGCGQGILQPTYDSEPHSYLTCSKHVQSDDPN